MLIQAVVEKELQRVTSELHNSVALVSKLSSENEQLSREGERLRSENLVLEELTMLRARQRHLEGQARNGECQSGTPGRLTVPNASSTTIAEQGVGTSPQTVRMTVNPTGVSGVASVEAPELIAVPHANPTSAGVGAEAWAPTGPAALLMPEETPPLTVSGTGRRLPAGATTVPGMTSSSTGGRMYPVGAGSCAVTALS